MAKGLRSGLARKKRVQAVGSRPTPIKNAIANLKAGSLNKASAAGSGGQSQPSKFAMAKDRITQNTQARISGVKNQAAQLKKDIGQAKKNVKKIKSTLGL